MLLQPGANWAPVKKAGILLVKYPSHESLGAGDIMMTYQMEQFPRHWSFVRGIHWSTVNSPYKGHGRRALIFYLGLKNDWVSIPNIGDLRRHRAHYNGTVMVIQTTAQNTA